MDRLVNAVCIAIAGSKLDRGPKLAAIVGAIAAVLGEQTSIRLWQNAGNSSMPYVAETKKAFEQALQEGVVSDDFETMPASTPGKTITIHHYGLTVSGRNYVASMRREWRGTIAFAKCLAEIKGDEGTAAALVSSVMVHHPEMLSFPPAMWADFVDDLKALPSATAVCGSALVGRLLTNNQFPLTKM